MLCGEWMTDGTGSWQSAHTREDISDECLCSLRHLWWALPLPLIVMNRNWGPTNLCRVLQLLRASAAPTSARTHWLWYVYLLSLSRICSLGTKAGTLHSLRHFSSPILGKSVPESSGSNSLEIPETSAWDPDVSQTSKAIDVTMQGETWSLRVVGGWGCRWGYVWTQADILSELVFLSKVSIY